MNLSMISGLIALVLLIFGIISIKDRVFSVGIGRPPIVFVTLRENYARVMGSAFILGAVINLLSILITNTRADTSITRVVVTSVGSFLVLGFIFCLLLGLQSAVAFGYWLRKHNSDTIKQKR